MPGLLPLIFAGSRLLVGVLFVLYPNLSATLLLLPHPPATILLIRCCGVREFVVGGLLYAAIRAYPSPSSSSSSSSDSASASPHAADSRIQRHALIAGATVDSLDLLVTIWTWVVGSGNLAGGPAGIIAACAGINLLMGFACIRDLPILGAKS